MNKQAGLGVPHSRSKCQSEIYSTRKIYKVGSLIIPLHGSILQVGTYKISTLAENPRWSRVWQYSNGWGQTKTKCPLLQTNTTIF